MARSPILSQSQIPEKLPPLTFAPGNFDGSFGNQAGPISDCHTRGGYNQVGKLMVRDQTLLTSMHKAYYNTRVGGTDTTH